MTSTARPALVLAGSLGATPEMWSLQLPHWRERFDVHAFAWPGHGGPAQPDAVDVASLARGLLTWADALGLKRFHYVGLSLGGMVGLELGRQATGRIDRMVLANCRYGQVDATRAFWNRRIADVAEGGMQSIAQDTLERWLTPETIARHPDRADQVLEMLRSIDPAGYIGCAAAVRDLDAATTLHQIAVPCLAISGDSDGAAPTAIMKQMASQMPACTHRELTQCSHLSPFDAPEAFQQAVDEFLKLS